MVAGQASGAWQPKAFILSPGQPKAGHSEWTEVTASFFAFLLFCCLKSLLKIPECLAYVYSLQEVSSSFRSLQLWWLHAEVPGTVTAVSWTLMSISPFRAGTQKIHLLDSLVAGDFWEMISTAKCDERHRDRGRPWILEWEQVPHFSSLGSRVLLLTWGPHGSWCSCLPTFLWRRWDLIWLRWFQWSLPPSNYLIICSNDL